MAIKYPVARGIIEMQQWGHKPSKFVSDGEIYCISSDCEAKIRVENWSVVFSNFRKNCPARYK